MRIGDEYAEQREKDIPASSGESGGRSRGGRDRGGCRA